MSNYLDRAQQLCESVKAAYKEVPVIVGGIHPSVMPDECLKFSDIVCVGEGEDAILAYSKMLGDAGAYKHLGHTGQTRASWIGSWFP